MKKPLPENYDNQKRYTVEEAAALLPQLSTSKFVGSVDADIVLNITEKQKKESIRGSLSFTNNFGKAVEIIVFGEEKEAAEALKAGAVAAGLDDLIKKVEDGKIQFDVVIATPAVMPKIARLGKVLGPKGLMPNPASGTVTTDVTKAIESYKSGKQNFKMSEQGAIRMRVAKLDMTPEQIKQNILDLLQAVYTQARRLNAQTFKRITLSPTMGKPVKLDTSAVIAELK